MEHTIIKDKDQIKLDRMKGALNCARSFLEIAKDSKGHIFVFLDCHVCEEMSLCRKIKKVIEDEFNK